MKLVAYVRRFFGVALFDAARASSPSALRVEFSHLSWTSSGPRDSGTVPNSGGTLNNSNFEGQFASSRNVQHAGAAPNGSIPQDFPSAGTTARLMTVGRDSLVASFATGVARDIEAVRAAIVSPWSNGQTEEKITKTQAREAKCTGVASLISFRPD